MRTPYIGITDFENVEQVRKMKVIFGEHQPKPRHTLMVGVMMSRKTLRGIPTRFALVFPKKEKLAEIFSEPDGVFNTLHYADYHNESTTVDFLEALRWCGPHTHAIQLDMTWPDPRIVEELKNERPDISIVLQVGKSALDAGAVVPRLLLYEKSVDYILLDRSIGKGLPLDVTYLNSMINVIKSATLNWKLGIAVAGGLGPGTVRSIKPLLEEYGSSLSIDAQSRLRKSGNAMHPIDWDLAEQYAREALALFSNGVS